jgi:hypothetical protein
MIMFSRLKEGLSSISSQQKLDHEDGDTQVTERFRALMLELAASVDGEKAARLALRIRCAATLQSLWFMRSDMMALLAPAVGEVQARHRLESISAPVREALPSGLRSRPSPLARGR